MKSVLDSRAAWITASAALAILTIAYGAPLVVGGGDEADRGRAADQPRRARRRQLAELCRRGVRRHRRRLAGRAARHPAHRDVRRGHGGAGLVLSSSGGMVELYAGHGIFMGLFGTSCMFSPLLTYVSRWFERRRGRRWR